MRLVSRVAAAGEYHRSMDTPARIKLADVAAAAGVSVPTVSKVVNGRYGVSAATTEAVQRAIDELGYAGNLSAAALRAGKTQVLGVLVAEFDPFAAELLKGADKAARGSGYELLAHSGGFTHGWERRSLARLGGTLIDGAVIVTPTVLDGDMVVPVVAVDPHFGPNRLPTIDVDNFDGTLQATHHLIELGHRRIGFLGGRNELDSAQSREGGFRHAHAQAGLEVDPTLVVEARYQAELAATITESWLDSANPPTAIVGANDVSAIAAMNVAQNRGLSVPADLSVVGFDDVPDAALATPPLTTVREPLHDMGAAAMQMLLDRIDGNSTDTHVRLPIELVLRDSTAPPRPVRA